VLRTYSLPQGNVPGPGEDLRLLLDKYDSFFLFFEYPMHLVIILWGPVIRPSITIIIVIVRWHDSSCIRTATTISQTLSSVREKVSCLADSFVVLRIRPQ
jgi:hypothetical protein